MGRAGRRGPRFAAARARRTEGPRRPPRCLPPRPRRRGCGVRRRCRALRPGGGSGDPGGARVPGGGSGGGSSNSGSGAPSPGALGSRSALGSAFSEWRCRCGSPGAARSGEVGRSPRAAAAPCPAVGLGGSAAARPPLRSAPPRRAPPRERRAGQPAGASVGCRGPPRLALACGSRRLAAPAVLLPRT